VKVVSWWVLDYCYALVGVCVCDYIAGSNCCA
jgi:hypothetical protein